MKKIFFSLGLVAFSLCFSQKTINATTESGKNVILNENGTWNYVTTQNQANQSEDFCDLASIDEYKARKSGILTIGEARVKDLKKHIAVDLACEIDKIKIIAGSEQKGNALYNVCACNKKVKYQRIGTVFLKESQNPFK